VESADSIRTWFHESLAAALAAAFEAMAGDKPAIQCEPFEASLSPEPGQGMLRWCQTFQGLPGAVWANAAIPDWTSSAQQILRAAGLEDTDATTLKSAYLDLLGRSMDHFAQLFAHRWGREVARDRSEEAGEQGQKIHWAILRLPLQGTTAVEIRVGADQELLDAILATSRTQAAPPVPKTLDLLLDVELPVSVSFGRAQIALKDVLKLTTGSILELDRTIAEPVEIIVNNCPIARGEVVVVEGNFGVRVLQVISRQERLKTLS
jgi:flagellar motor switch protein FliN/FliY